MGDIDSAKAHELLAHLKQVAPDYKDAIVYASLMLAYLCDQDPHHIKADCVAQYFKQSYHVECWPVRQMTAPAEPGDAGLPPTL